MRAAQHPDYPIAVFYAFKQSEGDEVDGKEDRSVPQGIASTGWETMLSGLMQSGMTITGTLPIRTELTTSLKKEIGALASSVVVVCRPRSDSASQATRRQFLVALRKELPEALRNLRQGSIAPVDLAQAAIGPGMGIFSRYRQVIEPNGEPMRVRTALQLINQSLDEVLAEQEGEYDAETRWAVTWFSQYGTGEGPYGEADVLARAKGTAPEAMARAKIIYDPSAKVRLVGRDNMDGTWDPSAVRRLTVWELVQHLIRVLEGEGEDAAGRLLAKALTRDAAIGDAARDLAYRLYLVCERKGWAAEARAYNGLAVIWREITGIAGSAYAPEQGRLL